MANAPGQGRPQDTGGITWKQLPNGDWVPNNHPAASQWTGGTATETTPPAGTTSGGVKPPSAVNWQGNVSVTGPYGTAGLSTSPTTGNVTGTSPVVPVGSPGTWIGSPMNQLQNAMRPQILSLLGQDINSASLTDPDLAPQAQAYAGTRERQRRDEQEALIERLGAMGLTQSGAADAAVGQTYETAGQDIASYNAGLIGEKLDDRRQMLETALGLATSMGMQDEANNLQRQLANLNATMTVMGYGTQTQGQNLQAKIANLDADARVYLANLDADLRREGYSTQERLAAMDTELRRYGIDVQGNLGLLNAVMQLVSIGTQNQQFYDSLGWDMAQFGYLANQGIVNSLFG